MRLKVTKFVIAPHMRLHEWIAVEKGYFDEADLDYVLVDDWLFRSSGAK